MRFIESHLPEELVILNGDQQIRERVKVYLKRDETGVRKAILELFLSDESYTTKDVYTSIKPLFEEVSYRGVSAMVGLMNTRLGILSVNVNGKHNIYSLKGSHKDSVVSVLRNI
ncbi:MAG: DUF2551 domain-containing protein [Halobacteriota archaeon]|nr:DUF2551 domain-containing protein [Halobacteriota archaeon]